MDRISLRVGLCVAVVVLIASVVAAARPTSPMLGNYPSTMVVVSANVAVTPDAAPGGATSVNVSSSSKFKGTFVANPGTGVVRVTNAHPAGTYTVTVKAFDAMGTTDKTFTLTVVSGTPCNSSVQFANAADANVGNSPASAAIGDFNNDGKQDLAIGNLAGASVSIRLGDGMGGFSGTTNVSVGALPFGIAIGDFDNDGNQDIAATNFNASAVAIRLGDGLGGFSGTTTVGVGTSPLSIAVGDFNKDGKQDLAVTNQNDDNVSIRLGDGLGGFSGTTNVSVAAKPSSIALGDFNNDGNQDFATANSVPAGTVSIRLGDGLGGFSGTTNVSVGGNPSSVAIGDFNNNGNQDFAAAYQTSHGVSIRLGDGFGAFSGTTEVVVDSNPFSIAIGDFGNDGNQDFVTVDEGANIVSVRLGDGAGNFSPVGGAGNVVGDSPRAVAIGDFNNDGKQDLAVPNATGSKVSIRLGGCFPGLTDAVSRKTHNATPFDINLPLTGQAGVECRTGGTGGDHSLVFTFTTNITSGGAAVTSGTGTTGSILIAGNTMRVPLTGVTDQQQLTVTLNNVTDASSNVMPPTAVRMIFLLGDTNGNKTVNSTDVSQTKSRSGQVLDATNFRSDTNVNGIITATDVSQVKVNSGHGVP
jgi:VCBS repeat protein/FG-GAP repeat protein